MIKKHIATLVGKYLGIVFIASVIAGCQSDPTAQGQQYLDGQLIAAFNLSQPQVGRPINVSDYVKQVNLIKQVSPSLYKKNQATYQAIDQWIAKNLTSGQFNQVGLSSYQASGKDNRGNVHLTGYYTPVLKARHKPDAVFRYPLYAKPTNSKVPMPSREAIYNGALDGKQLEIAYTNSLIDNFIMEVQGSGYIDFEDGQPLVFLGYSGKNGHPYQSIGRLLIEQGEIKRDKVSMQAIKAWADKQDEQTVLNLLKQNASAVFFKPQYDAPVVGSTGIPLVAKASVASDPTIIPAGSVMLVDVPLLDAQGIYQAQRELRLMVALDIGGAIKGQHLDVYQGIGSEAGHQAGYYNHYGRVWLIRPAPNSHLATPQDK
ncbi:membrane-bound lytic murein transglycosylase A [Orbus hercynius]|uniref:Membrane-bound lytic murein transglycosylase A n=1 Tax=Orbus hercynius TaxID=593135 RepID=A0A495RCM7_9GAMM|nr:murein transglycosylase A [Orbus hercynius]RKS85040.1 membrane-bound lytic murein transglycosylase A [Orbus hercynius]